MIYAAAILRRFRLQALLALVLALASQPSALHAQAYDRGDPYDDRRDGYDERRPAAAGDYDAPRGRETDRDAPRGTERGDPDWRDPDSRADQRDDRDEDRGERAPWLEAFYDALDEYGHWEQHRRYGDIWVPGDINRDWRPYTVGNWTYTEEFGWYWISTEPWGWATYHYGRWAFDDRRGWFWIPGEEWAPAWVTWRYSNEFVGWAPLPPHSNRWRDDDDYFLDPQNAALWVFVRPGLILTPGLQRFAHPARLNARVLSITRPAPLIGNASPRGGASRGIDVRLIERLAQRPVTPARVAVTENRRDPSILNPRFGSITVFKPRELPRGPSGPPSRWSQPQGISPGGQPRHAPTAAGAPPAVTPNTPPPPGAREHRRPETPGSPPSGPAEHHPTATSPAGNPGAAPQPAPTTPPRPVAPATPPASATTAPPAPPRAQNHDAVHTPPAPPPPLPPAKPPAPPQAGAPVQPRIINQAPPAAQIPPPRPQTPAAGAPPPQPAPPAASQAGGQPKDHKAHEQKKKPDEPPPAK